MTDDQKKRVNDYLAGCHRKAYRLGVWDCALFCADALQCLGAPDFAADFRGKYSTPDEYQAILPVPLCELPAHCGMKPCGPQSGAVFWMPSASPSGDLGFYWQGRALHPGKRGIIEITRDLSSLKFYSL